MGIVLPVGCGKSELELRFKRIAKGIWRIEFSPHFSSQVQGRLEGKLVPTLNLGLMLRGECRIGLPFTRVHLDHPSLRSLIGLLFQTCDRRH